ARMADGSSHDIVAATRFSGVGGTPWSYLIPRKRFRAGILGLGQCFRKMAPGLVDHFDVAVVFDPNPLAPGRDALTAAVRREPTYARSEREFFDLAVDLDCVFVLSPPAEHTRHVSTSLALSPAVFVEKPLAIDVKDLQTIKETIQRANGRLYCSD